MALYNAIVTAFAIFGVMSMFMLIQHEISLTLHPLTHQVTNYKAPASAAVRQIHGDRIRSIKAQTAGRKVPPIGTSSDAGSSVAQGIKFSHDAKVDHLLQTEFHDDDGSTVKERQHRTTTNAGNNRHHDNDVVKATNHADKAGLKFENQLEEQELEMQEDDRVLDSDQERKGVLMCNGSAIDSEVIYWKIVQGDDSYESPITPHHGQHDDRYLTFEYDAGGWNNVRMGMECLIVVAHAMGRTLVVPPQQHLYLLGATHKDKEDTKPHDEMGFEDFFDLDLLRSHRGFHVMHMEDFLEKEAVTGGLKGILPPGNSSTIWGPKLWHYLKKVANEKPQWQGKYVAFPSHPGDFDMTLSFRNTTVKERMHAFGGERHPVFYDSKLQQAHHIHFPAEPQYRLLQHHYAFAFFANPEMQSFYRRFVRDYMRYKDSIQCSGHELLQLVRAEARNIAPEFGGDYYALHVRRGDFQFKDVKLSAEEIVQNLHYPNGTSIIPRGAMVYLSTDDPDGVCKGCMVQRKPCNTYVSPKPVGCPEDTSWKAFTKAGWKVRFMRDFLRRGYLNDVNPNVHGMVESIVCSRAKIFAGTYFSTFTGYIHRLRGYHGLGESTFYHHKKYVMWLQKAQSMGHGFSREWRAGWTDDAGGQI